ncbi:MAG: histidine kinase dimerization/phospho-acceptor domain-containing protein, partial [bacterium]|nr:histidine kinase dimerization/phospho-acceptor domain-containing protein [bacterium]
MNLLLPMAPVHVVDVLGSLASIAVGFGCYAISRKLSRKDANNPLWTYLFWISVAFFIFTVSRSLGHLVRYYLTISGHGAWWENISPLSGAINSMTFVVVATLTFYYKRIQENYDALRQEQARIIQSEQRLEESHSEICALIDAVREGRDLSIRFTNSQLVACWSAKECGQTACAAYRSPNLRCWHLNENTCCSRKDGAGHSALVCAECEIYRGARGDPLQRLGERFNDMMNILEAQTLTLESANRKLMALDVQKSKFLEIVAHDLRTPLTSILSYADLLLRYKDEAEETRDEFLRTIIHESRRLGDLINDYLDLSKIESGLMEFRQERLDFKDVIDQS